MENPNLLSPSVLCFVGDDVYGLYVRTALAEVNLKKKSYLNNYKFVGRYYQRKFMYS